MSWTEVVNSTSANPYDINNDFLHCAQGSISPRTGTNMNATTGVYNIGSSTYKWSAAYFANTITTTYIKHRALLAEVYLTSTAAEIEITGLDGDKHINYEIHGHYNFLKGVGQYTNTILYINGDSATTNYTKAALDYNSSSRFTGTTTAYIIAGVAHDWANGPDVDYQVVYLHAKTGTYRYYYSRGCWCEYQFGFYHDTSTAITSLKFMINGYNFYTETMIKLFYYGYSATT